MGLVNVPTVAISAGNHVNPGLVRIFYPVYGVRLAKMSESSIY